MLSITVPTTVSAVPYDGQGMRVMRWFTGVVLVCTMVGVAGCGEPKASAASGGAPAAEVAEAERLMAAALQRDPDTPVQRCPESGDQSTCLATQKSMLADWPKAWEGDYQAQRNVAFCLSDGCNGAIRVDAIQGCAWRLVILNAGHEEVDQTDTANADLYCGRLTPTERSAATTKAEQISNPVE